MKLKMDAIQFESRAEINDIIKALDQYVKEHRTEDCVETVKKLADKLDVMNMNW
jgi:hypothetical protein